MALSATAALVRAHYQSIWNRIFREAGVGGRIATWAMIPIAALTLVPPSLLAFRIGRDLGGEIAAAADPSVLSSWNALQATFTIGFALLASFRLSPSFPFARFGRYPIAPMQLLLADFPAAALEVFPLIALSAIVMTHAGLASRMPDALPLILLMALTAVLTMLALSFIFGALRAAISRNRLLIAGLLVVLVVTASAAGLDATRRSIKTIAVTSATSTPLAGGYRGLLEVRGGNGSGLAPMAVASSLVLLAVAAPLHAFRMRFEDRNVSRRTKVERPWPARSVAGGFATLFLRQLTSTTATRAQLLLPLLLTVPLALTSVLHRAAEAEGKAMPENLLAAMSRANAVPWYAVLPFLSVAMAAQIWLNLFGWDRGLRTLFAMPFDRRDLLRGKLRGLAAFTLLQSSIAAVPLFWVRPPTAHDLALAVTCGFTLVITAATVGLMVSIRFPRRVDGAAGMQVPLHLSWIAPATVGATIALLSGVHALGALAGRPGGLIALMLAALTAAGTFQALLPRLAWWLEEERERLVGM